MTENGVFHCDQAARKGKLAITKNYCLEECDSAQKGVKAECPVEVVAKDDEKFDSSDGKK